MLWDLSTIIRFFFIVMGFGTYYVCMRLSVFVSTFKLPNEAGMRVEEEDMSTVKWLSGYVNSGRRQEQSEDTMFRQLEKNCVTIQNQSPSIFHTNTIFQKPFDVKGTAPLTSRHQTPISNKQNTLSTDEKNNTYMFILQEGHIFFCTNRKLNTVIILRVIIFDITFMNEHQKHVNK